MTRIQLLEIGAGCVLSAWWALVAVGVAFA
jgi:hypothetical protein